MRFTQAKHGGYDNGDPCRAEVPRKNAGSVNGYYVEIEASASEYGQSLNIDHLSVEQAEHILQYLKAQPKRS